ncbi:hypothetical protein [Salinibacterium sp. TMP30]|uniref:hypothetical protein n=1 Tax=Salinibacterium sp. TMP30 TaxID=3138237 RepID=UPI003138F009
MNGGYRQLNASEIKELLGELLERAAAEGVEVDAYVIGGAAMAIHLGRTQLTPDVDGLFFPFERVKLIGRQMAEEHGLDPDWVNENARPFITFDTTDPRLFVEVELRGHKVRLASQRALLAMKMARYARKDYADITALILSLGITRTEQIVDLTYDVLGEESLSLTAGRDDLVILAAEALARVKRAMEQPH